MDHLKLNFKIFNSIPALDIVKHDIKVHPAAKQLRMKTKIIFLVQNTSLQVSTLKEIPFFGAMPIFQSVQVQLHKSILYTKHSMLSYLPPHYPCIKQQNMTLYVISRTDIQIATSNKQKYIYTYFECRLQKGFVASTTHTNLDTIMQPLHLSFYQRK